jgi:hypothetical protein
MLHVTNGTSVSLRDTRLGGTVVYWNDVLHEGPVPAGMSFDELTRVRERFIAAYYRMPQAEVSFVERNASLRGCANEDEVILWFEHDLYDQLQLIQILDSLAREGTRPARLSIIHTDRYLGWHTADELEARFGTRVPVAEEHFEIAQKAWKAFCAPEPTAIEPLVRSTNAALPYLGGALERHLQQFPALRNGVSRTERQILESIDSGLHEFGQLFLADQKREERIFMGDTTFRCHLQRLVTCRQPLVSVDEQGRHRLTGFGRAVMGGSQDHVRANGINRWLGGVHLCEGAPVWRWDTEQSRLALS